MIADQEADTLFSPEAERPAPKGDIAPGTIVGEYVFDRLIAQGGCGAVYMATHRGLGRRAAIKVLHGTLAVSPRMIERFTLEVELVRGLRHPNIVEIYDLGEMPDGRPYYAMEYLAGPTLEAYLDARGRLSPDEALDILEPVCAALGVVHEAGIIHRDVKASNISLGGGDGQLTVKLLDFGIAKLVDPEPAASGLTSDGRRLGTPIIMAPEQILGEPIDARIDVYALGILLHRMLTGALPFSSPNLGDLVRQHLEEPAPRPSNRAPLAPALDGVVLRCLEKQPIRRFETVGHFLTALREAVGRTPAFGLPSVEAPASAVGIYVEVRAQTMSDELHDALAHDLSRVLDLAEHRLQKEGFRPALATGGEILALSVVPPGPASRDGARRAALATATALFEELARRPGEHAGVDVTICVHAAEALVLTSARHEVVGGPIARTAEWRPPSGTRGLFATPAAVEGLAGVDMVADASGLFVITREGTGAWSRVVR